MKTILLRLRAGAQGLAALVLFLSPLQNLQVQACETPVFMYAMDNWPADAYTVLVFHRGPLSGADAAAVALLEENAYAGVLHANMSVRTFDIESDTDIDDSLRAVLATRGDTPLPWIAALYPVLDGGGLFGDGGADVATGTRIAWSGTLTPDHGRDLMASPARQRLAEQLLEGVTAVWILLESGNNRQDREALRTLQESLGRLERTLRLPPLVDITGEEITPSISFPIMRLRRNDPEESVLHDILLNSERDLRDIDAPMAFPVFGRGIILYALAGAGINSALISEAAEFLTGPCSCEIKALNPGVDMIMAVDWDRLASRWDVADTPVPFGLAEFAARAEEAQQQMTVAVPGPNASDAGTPDNGVAPPSGASPARDATETAGQPARNVAILLLAVLAVIAVAAGALHIRNRNRET